MEEIQQGSHEWHMQRLGKATASRICEIIATTKGGWGASRKSYATDLILERLNGNPTETFCNDAMRHGTETEPDARRAYEFRMDVDVVQVSFMDHPRIPMSGCSPDGLVGLDGLIEIKCPTQKTHLETLIGGKVPAKYVTQMQWQMAVTGRQWCDFVSFDNRFPPSMQLFVQRVMRDDAEIERLESLVSAFLGEVDNTVSELRRLYEPQLEQAA